MASGGPRRCWVRASLDPTYTKRRRPETHSASPASNLRLGLRKAARSAALPWCPAGAGARPRATAASAQAFAVRFLAADFFIGAFFFAADFTFAAALAMSFPSSVFRPNQFRNKRIMRKRRYFVDREQRIPRGMEKLCARCVASSPQNRGFRSAGCNPAQRDCTDARFPTRLGAIALTHDCALRLSQ